jgi:F0F1-type ATP synthase epsilon subunit
MFKYLFLFCTLLLFHGIITTFSSADSYGTTKAMKQLESSKSGREEVVVYNKLYQAVQVVGYSLITLLGSYFMVKDGWKFYQSKIGVVAVLLLCVSCVGCWQPFKPVVLETVSSNEEAFLLPYVGDLAEQTSSNTEQYLKDNLVFKKQIQIPMQWISKGYETVTWNGEWQPAATLIKVDKSPVTREWTADANRGTSEKDEAIWVMTADQVEFSTGWTCTARIPSRDDAVKFLHNYPSGSLSSVMDKEIRAKLQAEFAMQVTDLPMETLREAATPHLTKVRDTVIEFFRLRGIEITNLGITGGFVYKDPEIKTVLVKVFNAEQNKEIAKAETAAQEEQNKQIQLEADGKAKAILTAKKAEADGIKMVADAKAYEMTKAQENPESYFALKQIELEKEKLTKWNGSFPSYYMGGMGDNGPEMLLQVPTFSPPKATPVSHGQ